ncbi:MAG: hypothetical protein ACXVHT_01610 [Methanobacterium sp.]
MFGMTKKQFLKRSKKALNETGGELLLIREIIYKEKQDNMDYNEISKELDNIRKVIESIFFEFERLRPPSRCDKLYLRILRSLTTLQESVTLNSEYLSAAKNGLKEKSKDKFKESLKILEEFRKEFHILVKEIDTLLNEK